MQAEGGNPYSKRCPNEWSILTKQLSTSPPITVRTVSLNRSVTVMSRVRSAKNRLAAVPKVRTSWLHCQHPCSRTSDGIKFFDKQQLLGRVLCA